MQRCVAYAPGEVIWNVVDRMRLADGVAIWQDEVLFTKRVPGGENLLNECDELRQAFEDPDW